jgi:hypothetical protein
VTEALGVIAAAAVVVAIIALRRYGRLLVETRELAAVREEYIVPTVVERVPLPVREAILGGAATQGEHLVVAVSATCGSCAHVLEALRTTGREVHAVLTGPDAEVRALLPRLGERVVADRGGGLTHALGITLLPAAVVIDAAGRLGSEAIGADAVLEAIQTRSYAHV